MYNRYYGKQKSTTIGIQSAVKIYLLPGLICSEKGKEGVFISVQV
jgi:hypothetical protein